MTFVSFSTKKIIFNVTVPTLSLLNSFTPAKSNLHLANSLAAAVMEPDLHRPTTYHVPNLTSHHFSTPYVVPKDQSRLEA